MIVACNLPDCMPATTPVCTCVCSCGGVNHGRHEEYLRIEVDLERAEAAQAEARRLRSEAEYRAIEEARTQALAVAQEHDKRAKLSCHTVSAVQRMMGRLAPPRPTPRLVEMDNAPGPLHGVRANEREVVHALRR